MTIKRPLFIFSIANAAVFAAACSVFKPPPNGGLDSGLTDNTGGHSGKGSGGGQSSGGSHDASVMNGGASGAGGSASGGMSSSGGSPADSGAGGGGPSGPTAPWWPHKTSKGCDSAGVPTGNDRVKSDPGATVPPIYFAVNRFRLGAVDEKPDPKNPQLTYLPPNENAWQDIGFDLDGACTNSATCLDPKTDMLIKETVCANSETIPFDGNKCVDNSIGKLFNIAATAPTVGEWFGLTENDWNCEMWRGGFSVIFKVSNYNGQYNDDSVTVDLYTSIGLKVLPQWYCRKTIDDPLATDWNAHAAWPTKSHWIISQDSISLAADMGTEVPDSKWQDRTAFVRGGWLIVQFPDNTWFWFDGERTPVPGFREVMHRPIMSVQLVHDPQSDLWRMDNGTIGYVAKPAEMLEGFQQLGFCSNMCGTFTEVKNYLNTYQDSLSVDNNAPASTPCDALSFGTVFRAAQITADATDVQPTQPFTTCPQPRSKLAPRQGCKCSTDGSTCTSEGGI